MPTTSLPLWIQFVQALGPTLVAIVAAVIASLIQYRQWRLAHDKLRYDLFGRRLTVFNAMNAQVMGTDGDVSALQRRIATIVAEMDGYRFLFPEEVVRLIDTAHTTLLRLSTTCNAETEDLHRAIINLMGDYNSQLSKLNPYFIKHLRLSN